MHRIRSREHEATREHSDHGKLVAIKHDGPANHLLISSEVLFPQFIAEQRHLVAAFVVFFFREVAANGRLYSEQGQQRSGCLRGV